MTAPLAEEVFLIVADNILVAEDVRQSILEYVAGAAIIIARTHDDALASITADIKIGVAVITTPNKIFAASDLAQALSSFGTRIVLTEQWDLSFPQDPEWVVLPVPFTSQDIHSVLTAAR